MDHTGVVSTVLLVLTFFATYKAFITPAYYEKYLFWVDGIMYKREFYRLISSGFLHVNWLHLGFNMLALLSFGNEVEALLGHAYFVILYFLSMICGNLLALWVNKGQGDYRAVGASGAISGILASFMLYFPTAKIGMILLPFTVPAWLFGLAFVLISIIGMERQKDNIGHEAHLGGLIAGILFTVIFNPVLLVTKWWFVLLLLVPSALFFFWFRIRREILYYEGWDLDPGIRTWGGNALTKEQEINAILDKINQKGMDSLTFKERKRLKELTDEIN